MSFSIRILDVSVEFLQDDPTIPTAIGEIRIGAFVEEFTSVLHAWTVEDYSRQWKLTIERLLAGSTKEAFITEYFGEGSNNLWWWPTYRVDDILYFQNQLLMFDQLDRPFSISTYSNFVRDRRILNNDGTKISEWSLPLEDLRQFAMTLQG